LLRSGCVRVISAHQTFAPPVGSSKERWQKLSDAHARSSAMWKDAVVRKHLASELRSFVDQERPELVQVLSVGDAAHDMRVAYTLAAELSAGRSSDYRTLVKTVKLQDAPGALQFHDQLRRLSSSFRAVRGVAPEAATRLSGIAQCGQSLDSVCRVLKTRRGRRHGASRRLWQLVHAKRRLNHAGIDEPATKKLKSSQGLSLVVAWPVSTTAATPV